MEELMRRREATEKVCWNGKAIANDKRLLRRIIALRKEKNCRKEERLQRRRETAGVKR